jgi:hypothetical protein
VTSNTITREELYDLVWQKPISKLAVELGISDVGLSKICRRHEVPTPPRGYWARLEAGYTDPKAPLKKRTTDGPDRIEIGPSATSLEGGIREDVIRARAAKPDSIEVKLHAPAEDLHPAIKRTAQKLRNGKPNREGIIEANGAGMCGISVRPQDSERIIAILNALAPALEGKGITFTAEGSAMRAARGRDDAVFRLTEILIKEPHIPTPEEVAAEEKRQKRISRETGWSTYALSNPRAYPDFDWVRKGQFTLAIDSNGSGARRTWSDGKTQTLEALLPAIVSGFDVFFIRAKAQREDREERARQFDEMQRRRALFRQRGEREKKRTERLASLLATFDEIDALERLISRLDAAPDTQSSRLVVYTRARLDSLRARVGADGLEAKLTADSLFPDPDPLYDPLGDPPGGYYW